MKRFIFLSIVLLLVTRAYTQVENRGVTPSVPIIYFNYDNAGNQIQRYYCANAEYCVTPPLPSQINDETNEFETFKRTDSEGIINYFNVYPNPTTGKITISWTEEVQNLINKIEVVSYSTPYYKDLTFSNKELNVQVDISMENTGIYIIKFHLIDSTFETIQVIKE